MSHPSVLTIDLGTTVVKADVWDGGGLRASGSTVLRTSQPGPRHAEQDASTWWPAVVEACAHARVSERDAYGAVDVVALSGARQTFVATTADGLPLGPAVVWSDRRASAEADALAARAGGVSLVLDRTGQHLDGGSVAAKLAWMDHHDPQRLAGARWVLTPRDLLILHLAGQVVSDATMATASGLYDRELRVVTELIGVHRELLAPVVEPGTLVGALRTEVAGALALRAGTPVVIGAGDRACEVLGSGASGPLVAVSWGTTANASRAGPVRPDPVPAELAVTRAVEVGRWSSEAGLAAAGSLLEWVARASGWEVDALVQAATAVPLGAGGVVVLPWLGGARAPWWRDDLDVQVVAAHDPEPAEVARAVFEGVARDLHRCLRCMAGTGTAVEAVALTGRGAAVPLWVEVVTGVTGLPGVIRRSALRGSG
ncbi:MAG TPA: FGGY family carbohydrate kinase, partial [Acidimicrobiales bacterium]|nr:FGGY family carbohydrate kinase [Acidimicrobiales bacterium]